MPFATAVERLAERRDELGLGHGGLTARAPALHATHTSQPFTAASTILGVHARHLARATRRRSCVQTNPAGHNYLAKAFLRIVTRVTPKDQRTWLAKNSIRINSDSQIYLIPCPRQRQPTRCRSRATEQTPSWRFCDRAAGGCWCHPRYTPRVRVGRPERGARLELRDITDAWQQHRWNDFTVHGVVHANDELVAFIEARVVHMTAVERSNTHHSFNYRYRAGHGLGQNQPLLVLRLPGLRRSRFRKTAYPSAIQTTICGGSS